MRVVQANSPTTTVCAKTLNARCQEMQTIRNVISGGEPSALLCKEASSFLSREEKNGSDERSWHSGHRTR